MAIAPVRIPQLQQSMPVVDSEGRMTNEFSRRLNEILASLASALNQLLILPVIRDAITALDSATQAAQDAAAAASAAAAAAGTAADQSMAATEATKREAAIQGSYIDPDSVVTATPITVSIAAHVRRYADGTSANVSAGTVAATGPDDVDYVFYNDPARAGGAVTYQVSVDPPTQTGDTHVVGAVTIPAAGSSNGGAGPRRPGFVQARQPIE